MWHTEMHKQNVASWGSKEMYKCIVSGVTLVVQVQTLHFSIYEVGHSGYSYIKNRAEG